jgi:hypothetical protein
VADVIGVWARRLAASAAVACLAVLACAAPAAGDPAGDPAGDAVSALRTSGLYVAPGLPGVRVAPDVAAALPGDLKIAVFPASAGVPITLAGQIDQRLDADAGHPLSVGVFTVGGPAQVAVRAASSKYCPGVADMQAQAAASVDQAQLANADLSSTIRDFAQRLTTAKVDRNDCSAAGKDSGRVNTGALWAWIVGIVVVCAAAIGALVAYSRRRTDGDTDPAGDETDDDELSSVLSGAVFGEPDVDGTDLGSVGGRVGGDGPDGGGDRRGGGDFTD